MFLISPRDPLHPKLVGEPVDTLGDFPMSVTYSARLKTACVLNGGAKNGVACFKVSHNEGLAATGPLRPLPELTTTTPPSGPPDASSDIRFNPSSTAIFVITKGNPGPPPVPGNIYAFKVDHGKVGTTPVVSQPPMSVLEFSINFLCDDSLAVVYRPCIRCFDHEHFAKPHGFRESPRHRPNPSSCMLGRVSARISLSIRYRRHPPKYYYFGSSNRRHQRSHTVRRQRCRRIWYYHPGQMDVADYWGQ